MAFNCYKWEISMLGSDAAMAPHLHWNSRGFKKRSKGDHIFMSDENSTGNNLIWAITMIIVVALIAGAVYYSGLLGGQKKQTIDVEVSAPASTH